MGLPEELWFAMHDVASAARRENIPSFFRDLALIANISLDSWREMTLLEFAQMGRDMSFDVSSYNKEPDVRTGPCPLTTSALARLYDLLNYIGSLAD